MWSYEVLQIYNTHNISVSFKLAVSKILPAKKNWKATCKAAKGKMSMGLPGRLSPVLCSVASDNKSILGHSNEVLAASNLSRI